MRGQQVVIVLIDREVVEALAARPRQVKLRDLLERLSECVWRERASESEAGENAKLQRRGVRSHFLSLLPHRVRSVAATLAELIESGFESGGKFLGRASAPIMKENHDRTVSGHVVMNGNHVQTVLAKGF